MRNVTSYLIYQSPKVLTNYHYDMTLHFKFNLKLYIIIKYILYL